MIFSIYDYSHELNSGVLKNFLDYSGQVLLIVNTASKCGFTPQYKELEALYKEYKTQGLEILGFPADDFMHQEPGSDEEIAQFCELNFGVTFPLFRKSHVRGKEINGLYEWLMTQPKTKGQVSWNFEKFLISKTGEASFRFRSHSSPQSKEVLKALNTLLQPPVML